MRLALVLLLVARQRRRRQRARVRLLVLLRLRMLNKERNYLASSSLIAPMTSTWHGIHATRDRGSFIATVSLPYEAFSELLDVFSRHYVVKSGLGKPGRPPTFVVKHAVLACVLHYYTAPVEQKTLCELFGVPPSTLCRVMGHAERALDATLREIGAAAVRYPSKQQQLEWAAMVEEREPLLAGVWGFVDGKNYRVMSPSDSDLQNAQYNGKAPLDADVLARYCANSV
ncbi:hypothetical protein PF005_g2095 [Phytophthora fragariae]|uniref:DDE Tnp4 domain-containing protein n=1 Tax=Phytophthora fragariae TaxID=53985 RepID=A0A6A3ZQK2_9STRA|nr:hypothetical protein PF003_g35155 [Phytophthora fragariae]KAE8948150.1 hypothetical protein PF009_g2268 [Phytophthora fragariae]KAE9017261.1 hypothetical protein PF011_g6789 [Phytophthora fragariae]KAE9124674.1 hypothetical protein PF010_g5927 [Phytophthora fragariae]KAE9136656.1 hypothetical protein PF007_g2109 [Phytophthora fragariae]